jgi:hypothetical protein
MKNLTSFKLINFLIFHQSNFLLINSNHIHEECKIQFPVLLYKDIFKDRYNAESSTTYLISIELSLYIK